MDSVSDDGAWQIDLLLESFYFVVWLVVMSIQTVVVMVSGGGAAAVAAEGTRYDFNWPLSRSPRAPSRDWEALTVISLADRSQCAKCPVTGLGRAARTSWRTAGTAGEHHTRSPLELAMPCTFIPCRPILPLSYARSAPLRPRLDPVDLDDSAV